MLTRGRAARSRAGDASAGAELTTAMTMAMVSTRGAMADGARPGKPAKAASARYARDAQREKRAKAAAKRAADAAPRAAKPSAARKKRRVREYDGMAAENPTAKLGPAARARLDETPTVPKDNTESPPTVSTRKAQSSAPVESSPSPPSAGLSDADNAVCPFAPFVDSFWAKVPARSEDRLHFSEPYLRHWEFRSEKSLRTAKLEIAAQMREALTLANNNTHDEHFHRGTGNSYWAEFYHRKASACFKVVIDLGNIMLALNKSHTMSTEQIVRLLNSHGFGLT